MTSTSITATAQYNDDLNARRLFHKLKEELQGLGHQIEETLTHLHRMRTNVGNSLLSVSQIESMHVNQTHAQRASDTRLMELEAIKDMAMAQIAALMKTINLRNEQVAAITAQIGRTENDRFIVDLERGPPVEGFAYFDLEQMATTLGVSVSRVRSMVTDGVLPTHDAVEAGTTKPKLLWLKSTFLAAATRYKGRVAKGHMHAAAMA